MLIQIQRWQRHGKSSIFKLVSAIINVIILHCDENWSINITLKWMIANATWFFCIDRIPDDSKVFAKMLYAGTLNALKEQLPGVIHVPATGADEATEENIISCCKKFN